MSYTVKLRKNHTIELHALLKTYCRGEMLRMTKPASCELPGFNSRD